MFVVKRNGVPEPVAFEKITIRLRRLCEQEPRLSDVVDPNIISQKVIQGVYTGVKTTDLDHLAAETAAFMAVNHPDYGSLALRVSVSNLHKETPPTFDQAIEMMYRFVDSLNRNAPVVSEETYKIVQKYKDSLNRAINCDLDYNFNFFGFKTLERSYLLRLNDVLVERPQYLFMRTAIGVHGDDLPMILKSYHYMSNGYFTHATPTLFNSGCTCPQMSSCFLLPISDDSIDGIYKTLKDCALISKSAGGLGISVTNIRSANSLIHGSSGRSNGIVPMLRVYNNTARYVDQGGGKRKGAFAIYLEPWHADIFEWLDLRKNHGKEEHRARDLFYALWIPDLFMKRVENNEHWSLFCPSEAPGLYDLWGHEFDAKYVAYEKDGLARTTIKAQDLWFAILTTQIETGMPYMLFKDACNRKSNHNHYGTIRSSNLCTEIIQFSSKTETAVCNLASIALPKFIVDGKFDFQKLYEVAYHVAGNLDKVIDRTFYPIPEARTSNMLHRPMGIGVQGLADAFHLLGYSFCSPESRRLNIDIFETIYYAALNRSVDLAKEHGPYPTFVGSPASRGILQYNMWNVEPSDRWDWSKLKRDIACSGLRNSLFLAPMPTASTSNILGNTECIEPYTSNIYVRRVLAGEFTMINNHLIKDLMKLGMWNENMKNRIISEGGSVQSITQLPEELRERYRTIWEIKQRALIDMAADRGAFIDQSQSMNLFIESPNVSKLTSMHFYAWQKGLKTGVYYLRTRPAADAIQFTVDQELLNQTNNLKSPETAHPRCRIADLSCASCGS